MIRTHFSKEKEIVVRKVDNEETSFKPEGFWYSVDGDWERWCRAEDTGWLDGKNRHKVTLGRENMLCLGSVREIDLFHRDFHRAGYHGIFADYIDWSRVAIAYDGIEIAPYQWERRLQGAASRWYYPWDCASGVVWRPRGIKVELDKETACT